MNQWEQMILGFLLNALKGQEFSQNVTVDIGNTKLTVPVKIGPITDG